MKLPVWILLSWCLIAPELIVAQEKQAMADIPAFKAALAKFAVQTQTLQADFSQEKHLSFLENDIVSTGRFYFLQEKNLRWEYTDPFHYLIILREGEVLLQDGEKVSSFSTGDSRRFGQINDIMLLLVRGQLPSESDFGQSFFENQRHFILELTPRSKTLGEFLSRIVIHFDRERLLVDEIWMIEPSEDYTHIRFSGRRLNRPVSKTMFELN